jgi:hypothetical protein
MLPNGLIVVLDLALGTAAVDSEAARARYAAFVLGILREDVVLVPGLARALPSPSPGHLWPRSRRRCADLFDRAVAEPDPLAADVVLGRALHVLIDMACPVHAQAVWHTLRDPFERYVDVHAAELAALPVPDLAPWVAAAGPAALVDSLAAAARSVRADRRQTAWGRWRHRGDAPLRRPELAAQAERLIPLAAAHTRALVARYEECRSTP